MLNAAEQLIQSFYDGRQMRDYKAPHAHRGTPPRLSPTEEGLRGRLKRAARRRAADAYIETRDNPDAVNPRYCNSSPERRAAAPWPTKPQPQKRPRRKPVRAAETYRAAKRNASRARQAAARAARAAITAVAAE
ncbi:hypothetical protein [Amorphus sp. MBR-141]